MPSRRDVGGASARWVQMATSPRPRNPLQSAAWPWVGLSGGPLPVYLQLTDQAGRIVLIERFCDNATRT